MVNFLYSVCSGGQNGADIAGLRAAKLLAIPTKGWMTKGCRTLDGPKKEYLKLYNMKETEDWAYPTRTRYNVRDSDGTVRFAQDFTSPGEICTLNAIIKYGKPYFNVGIDINGNTNYTPEDLVAWIKDNDIRALNVAGNSEKTAPGIEKIVEDFLVETFRLLEC